jgi:hypothetical protein
VVARGFIEVAIALLLCSGQLSDSYIPLYCAAAYSLAALRSVYLEKFDLPFCFFVAAYFVQNFWVNAVDFVVFRKGLQVYEDTDFQEMFSFKLFQLLLCALFAFTYSQCLKPSFEAIRSRPFLLRTIYRLSLPLSLCQLLAFCFELRVYGQHKRNQLFQAQLAKVFASVVVS